MERAIAPFLGLDEVVEVVVALADPSWRHEDERVTAVRGGATRLESVRNALIASVQAPAADVALVHDGARPFPPPQAINACIRAASQGVGAVTGIPVVDTLKREKGEGLVLKTVSREGLWRAQTPQAFPMRPFRRAMRQAGLRDGDQVTDDASLMEEAGIDIRLVPGSRVNLKITHAEDLSLAQAYLRLREDQA